MPEPSRSPLTAQVQPTADPRNRANACFKATPTVVKESETRSWFFVNDEERKTGTWLSRKALRLFHRDASIEICQLAEELSQKSQPHKRQPNAKDSRNKGEELCAPV